MRHFTLIGALFIVLFASAQDQPLFTIGDQGVSADEFKAVYLKNRDIGKDIDPKTPSEYLDLYINFKLKVKEAHDMGMDTMPSFIREFESYRKQLAQPYLEDRTVDSMLLDEAYARMQLEVRAAHIMVDLAPDALPADTLAAYNNIMNIRAQTLKSGASFEELAKNTLLTRAAQITVATLATSLFLTWYILLKLPHTIRLLAKFQNLCAANLVTTL